MKNHSDRGGVTVVNAPSWCIDPKHCSHGPSNGKKCTKCRDIPHLPAAESNFVEGSHSLWVYYPHGILRQPLAETDLYSRFAADSIPFLPHRCGGAKSAAEATEAYELAPYPGHSLFQDSFFFCKFKKFGDGPGLSDLYVEIVVDGYSGFAFAKVYPNEHAMNAADIMATRVAPFFKSNGVPIEKIYTRKAPEYWGIAPMHPFETFLLSSHINHEQTRPVDQSHNSICEQFFTFLHREFLGRALRSRYQHSLETLQRDLDEFVNRYNSARPSFNPAMHGNPPLRAFPTAT